MIPKSVIFLKFDSQRCLHYTKPLAQINLGSNMRLYWELTWRAFQRQLTYRTAAFAGLATNFFFGLIRAAVMVALYQERQEIAGVTLVQAVTFTGLSQALIGTMSFFGWYELMDNVYSGGIGADLLKPMNLYVYWLARDVGRSIALFFLRSLPILVAYKIFLDVITPNSVVQWGAVIIGSLMAWLVSFSYRFALNLASFWTTNAVGVARFGFMLTWFLSGFMFPLRYFPDWFIKISRLTPFPHMINSLVEVYLGVINGMEIVYTIALQTLWFIILFAIGQLLFRIGIKRLVIVGG
jgi:ABC-2 type transport system permease protein